MVEPVLTKVKCAMPSTLEEGFLSSQRSPERLRRWREARETILRLELTAIVFLAMRGLAGAGTNRKPGSDKPLLGDS